MKRLLLLVVCLLLLLSGCNLKTEESQTTETGDVQESSGQETQEVETVNLTLATLSAFEKQANVVRDQLKKAGVELEVKNYADVGSYISALTAGGCDLSLLTFSGSGSPDGQIRDIFYTGGTANFFGLSDPEVDELMDKAASQTADAYSEAYKELEEMLIVDKTYAIPLWAPYDILAVNMNTVDISTVEFAGAGARLLWSTSFIDAVENETRTYNTVALAGSPDTFDSLRGATASTWAANTNTNIRLIQTDSDGNLTTRGTLSRNYAISGDNDTFYFILRDDVNFGKVEDMIAVDTGVKVSAEDVLYTLDRARDVISVPGNAGYGDVEKIKDTCIVTDINELKNAKISGSEKTVFESLNNGLENPCTELVETRDQVDNAAGKYQVVKITTKEPCPQQLINLGATQSGIVPKDIVSEVNKEITADNYDPNKDVLYGDITGLQKGDNYNNNMWFSGQYVVTHIDDYGTYLERNPGFAPDTNEAPKIKNIAIKVLLDNTTQTSSLRNGELDDAIPQGNNINICMDDPNIEVLKNPSMQVGMLYLNINGQLANEDLRHALLYAINQDELIAVVGNAEKAHSSLIMIDTGLVLNQDLAKAQEYVKKYIESNK